MSLTIKFTERADADIEAAFEYLEDNASVAAERLLQEINDRCELLAAQPRIGKSRNELMPGLRSTVIDQYLLFYMASEAALEVIRFLHGSRDYTAEFSGN